MKIGLFAQKVNLSTHTLRYYEKRGLIKVDRDQSGQRSYDKNDLAWVQFIQRLKDTGMNLKDIQRYADLRYQGDGSLKERLEMLQKHRSFVQEQIKNWQMSLKKLDNKIEWYQAEIRNLPKQSINETRANCSGFIDFQ